jgi:hypothetical protein
MLIRHSSVNPWTFLSSLAGGLRASDQYHEVRCYAMFVGQPRSGTSLVGSLLNAHRHVCVAQELNALRYVKRGYRRNQLYWLLQQRDRQFARRGRTWTGYDYHVPGQWQGRTDPMLVIGDKKAGAASELLGQNPQLLERLRLTVQVPVRMIHVVRNPFNVIATIHRKRKRTSFALAASMYFDRCATNWRLMQDPKCELLTIRLERLIAEPVPTLVQLCQFIGVRPPTDYLDACRRKLFDSPRQSQQSLEWPTELVELVYRNMQDYPFLSGYEFRAQAAAPAA